jgi:Subtilase family
MAAEEKYLPIRLFQKRDLDTRETEGGGGSDPGWVLTDDSLSAHATEISAQFTQSFSDYLTADELVFSVPLPVGVKLQETATAKSHRESIEKVFIDENSKITSIGFSPRNELLFALNTKEHIKQVSNKLDKPEDNKKGISAISKVEKYKPAIEEELDLKGKLKIKLIPYENMAAKKYLKSSFTAFCNQLGVAVKKCNYSISSEIYKASNVTPDSLVEISAFNGVLSIESMPTYEFGPEWIAENKNVDIKLPDQNKDYPKIGVLDSGISKIDYLSPWIFGEMSQYTDAELDKSHGTFVAGLLLYGDVLEDKTMVGCYECRIFDGAIISDKKLGPIDEDELLDNIREIVSNNRDEIKIWNLSIGSKKEASMQSFSDFGMGLDEIQDNNKILIVKSVGNCRNFERGEPPCRISESADSVRSIVVGSIAHLQTQTDISPVNHISPFSRVGPGPQHIIKPELVQYGGNSGLSAVGVRIDTGVLSFSTDGKIICDCGTSFSTPRVSALMASLNHDVMGDFNELLIKTLSIHSARYPHEVNDPIDEKLMRYGFGLPPSTDNVLLNSPNEITLILQDDLPKGHFVEILEFPFPDNLVDKKGRYNAEIIVTLVNKQLLDDSQGKEYCQSDIEIAFGTYDSIVWRDVSKSYIKNPIGRDNSMNILRENLYSRRRAISTGPAFEPILIQNGKYHPVKKFHCDLSRMTEANKRDYITAPKHWFLKLNGFYRSKAERISDEMGIDLSQKFCLAITIRDRSGKHDVYNQVAQFLDQRNFLHQTIELRPEVRVRH